MRPVIQKHNYIHCGAKKVCYYQLNPRQCMWELWSGSKARSRVFIQSRHVCGIFHLKITHCANFSYFSEFPSCFVSLFPQGFNATKSKKRICWSIVDAWYVCFDMFFVFPPRTGRSPLVPETTRKTLIAAASQTVAITVEKLSKSPASSSDTYEYTQVSQEKTDNHCHV